ILISKGSPITRSERFQETYKNVSQEIRDQLNVEAEAVQIILTGIDNDIYSTETYKNVSQEIHDQLNVEAEAVQIILTGIDNDIYLTVDACPNACEMWKAIETLKQGESINVQDLETNLYWEFGKFTSQDGESLESYYSWFYKMMNKLIRNQCKVTNHQVNVQFLLQLQSEWQRSQQAATRSRGKAIVNSLQPIYDQEPSMVAEDDETSQDKEIDKLMALISLSFKKIYKPTNNNLRTSSNSSRANQDNSPRINRRAGAKRIARVANPLELVAQQHRVFNPQTHPTQYTQKSSIRSQQAATRNRGKAIDKEIDKLMALISLSFKKIYKPTNNNLRTSSNTSRANQDNSPRINRSAGYENQRIGNVAGARETVEQADWRDDTDDDELED
nr:hypothetical protein [Tanacetum cinerariifolium]